MLQWLVFSIKTFSTNYNINLIKIIMVLSLKLLFAKVSHFLKMFCRHRNLHLCLNAGFSQVITYRHFSNIGLYFPLMKFNTDFIGTGIQSFGYNIINIMTSIMQHKFLSQLRRKTIGQ